MRVVEFLRQRAQPAAFRIAPPPRWESRTEVRRLLDVPPEADTTDDAAWADAATNLWRAHQRIAAAGREDKVARQAGHFLRNGTDALREAGVEAVGHDGQRYDPGLAMTVMAWEVDPTLPHDQVVRTVAPSVYARGRCIRQAQVIVGGPAPAGEHGQEGNEHG